MKIKRQFNKFVFLIFLLSLFACNEVETSKRKFINVALSTNVPTLDPALSYDTVSAEVVYQIHETLYEYDYLIRPYHLKPLLAKDMPTIEDNGLKYTIKLKKNILYHDSKFINKKRTLKAQDFINQIKRLAYKPTKSSGWWLFDGKIRGLNKFREEAETNLENFFKYNIEGLQAPDDHTLIIHLNKPYPQLLFALAMSFTTPVPEEIIRATNNDLSQGSIGTGPFYLEEWNKNLNLNLKRFDRYHPMLYPKKGDRFSYENNLLKDKGMKLPFIQGVKFNIVKEAQSRWLNFRAKKLDFIVLTKDHFQAVLDEQGNLKKEYQDQDIKLQIEPTLTYWWLAFNMRDKILGNNLKLRSAIAHAVDIDRYIKIFTNNIALKANSIYPPGVPGYDPSRKTPYQYNPNRAKELLREAGYPDGKGLPELKYDVRGPSLVSKQMAEFIKIELEKVGIRIKVVINSFPRFLQKARTGQLQFWQGGWAMDYPDAENSLQLLITKNHSPGPNSTYFSNKKVDGLYKKLEAVTSEVQKIQLLKEIEDIVHIELPWIMQFYTRNYILFHGNIKNFRQSDLIYNNYKYLKLE
jgi:oligopeptide transport system substrate-binding protein